MEERFGLIWLEVSMIDSLRVWILLKAPLSADVVARLQREWSQSRTYRKRVLNRMRYQIIPPHDVECGKVTAQCSLPKFHRGTNVEPLSLEATIEAANKFVIEVAEELQLGYLPSLDEVQVVWADIVYDWTVTSPEAYLAVFRDFIIERRNHDLNFVKNSTDKGSTVKFGSNSRKLSIYNKEAEVQYQVMSKKCKPDVLDKSRGRLRSEIRLAGRGWRKYIGDDSPNLKQVLDFLRSEGRRPLSEAWTQMTHGWESSTIESDVSKLVRKFGATKGRQVAGNLALIRAIGVPSYRQICVPSPSNFYMFRKALRDAEVAMTQASGLSPLSIPWFDQEHWRAKRVWSLWHLKSMNEGNPPDEFDIDDDGNLLDVSNGIPVTVVRWEDAA